MQKKLSLSSTFFRHLIRTIPFTPIHCILSLNEYQVEDPLYSLLSAQARRFISTDDLRHHALEQVLKQTKLADLCPEDREFIKEYLSCSEYSRCRHPHYRKTPPRISALRKRNGRRRSPRHMRYARETRTVRISHEVLQ
jgi:hypothetical protein